MRFIPKPPEDEQEDAAFLLWVAAGLGIAGAILYVFWPL